MDCQEYAVKKIRFDIRDSRLCFKVSCFFILRAYLKLLEVLREVKVLASLNHHGAGSV